MERLYTKMTIDDLNPGDRYLDKKLLDDYHKKVPEAIFVGKEQEGVYKHEGGVRFQQSEPQIEVYKITVVEDGKEQY